MEDGQILDHAAKQNVQYCIPTWLRDEQIKQSIVRVSKRLSPYQELRDAPIAVVSFGPSLADTWEEVKKFKYVMSCSGSHKFLVEHGIVPTWHVEVDPRAHKVGLIGLPQDETEYFIASTCHAAVFDHLQNHNVTLWHVFDCEEDAMRTLPEGEWALTGGCSVGLRTMTIARFIGFRDIHIFGMDGSEGATGKHAAFHPNQLKKHGITVYNEVEYKTTPGFLEAARQTFHELDMMPDVKPTFYGEGLVQAMFKDYVPKPVAKGKAIIGFQKPELISSGYRELNRRLHVSNLAFGVGGGKHAKTVLNIAEKIKTQSILDYGCGKGYLAKDIPFPIWEYDPAVEGKNQSPRPAELVVCTDVLEHIEPECIDMVFLDLMRCVLKIGYFTIHTGPSMKNLEDGRNAHILQRDRAWWEEKLKKHFTIGQILEHGHILTVVVARKIKKMKTIGNMKLAEEAA
jgi:hypothetical protein